VPQAYGIWIKEKEQGMGLVVLAQVIRELIADGEYLVECIEHRDHGKVAVAFALRSRAQPYSIQIETTDNKLGGLFRALLHEDPSRAGKPAVVKVGSQPVPIVEVDSLPLDTAKGRKPRRLRGSDADSARSRTLTGSREASAPSRSSGQQLALVPQDPAKDLAPVSKPAKRRQTAGAGRRNEMS
jgi:hypothetical protein